MARRPAAVTTNGHNRIHWPGAYAYVLQKVCERDTCTGGASVLMGTTDEDYAEAKRQRAERKAAVMAKRNGQLLTVPSHMMPDGMPSPLFDQWPRGGRQGSFTVTPDDVIMFKPRGIR